MYKLNDNTNQDYIYTKYSTPFKCIRNRTSRAHICTKTHKHLLYETVRTYAIIYKSLCENIHIARTFIPTRFMVAFCFGGPPTRLSQPPNYIGGPQRGGLLTPNPVNGSLSRRPPSAKSVGGPLARWSPSGLHYSTRDA